MAGQGKPSGDPSGLSASLAAYLTAQKTAAIRAELAQSPSVALAAIGPCAGFEGVLSGRRHLP